MFEDLCNPQITPKLEFPNSILSPNTFHFSTKVTLARKVDQIPESADLGTQ
jgi:hypothetical protein